MVRSNGILKCIEDYGLDVVKRRMEDHVFEAIEILKTETDETYLAKVSDSCIFASLFLDEEDYKTLIRASYQYALIRALHNNTKYAVNAGSQGALMAIFKMFDSKPELLLITREGAIAQYCEFLLASRNHPKNESNLYINPTQMIIRLEEARVDIRRKLSYEYHCNGYEYMENRGPSIKTLNTFAWNYSDSIDGPEYNSSFFCRTDITFKKDRDPQKDLARIDNFIKMANLHRTVGLGYKVKGMGLHSYLDFIGQIDDIMYHYPELPPLSAVTLGLSKSPLVEAAYTNIRVFRDSKVYDGSKLGEEEKLALNYVSGYYGRQCVTYEELDDNFGTQLPVLVDVNATLSPEQMLAILRTELTVEGFQRSESQYADKCYSHLRKT